MKPISEENEKLISFVGKKKSLPRDGSKNEARDHPNKIAS